MHGFIFYINRKLEDNIIEIKICRYILQQFNLKTYILYKCK